MTLENETTSPMERNDSSSEKPMSENSEKEVIQDPGSHSPHPDALDIGKDFVNEFEENLTDISEKSNDNSQLIPNRISIVDISKLEERSKSAENCQHAFTNGNLLLKYPYKPFLIKLKASLYPFEIPSLVVRSSLGSNETIRTIVYCDLSKDLQDLDEGIAQFHAKIVSISHVMLLAKVKVVNVSSI